jgi:hypothetical protein
LRGRLILNNEHDVFVILNEAEPGKELLHDSFVEVVDHSEFLVLSDILDHFLLYLLKLVIFIIEYPNRYLVSIIIQVNETVVKEEPAIALFPIAIINLITSLDVIDRLNHETSSVICVVPSGLSGSLMVEHVSIGNKTISLHTFNLNTENAAGHHHADFGIFLDWELSESWDFLTNQVIVCFDVNYFFLNLIKERGSL